MATDIKALLAARLAAAKKDKENGNGNDAGTGVQQAPATAVPGRVQQSSAESGSVRQETGGGERQVATGAELQSTAVVVVERETEADTPDGDGLRDTADGTVESSNTDLDLENPIHQQFLQRLTYLENALLTRDPLMKTHLAAIHKTMIEFEELPNLLRPHEIAKIMAAQQAHTNVILAVANAKKSKAATAKSLKNLTLDDI